MVRPEFDDGAARAHGNAGPGRARDPWATLATRIERVAASAVARPATLAQEPDTGVRAAPCVEVQPENDGSARRRTSDLARAPRDISGAATRIRRAGATAAARPAKARARREDAAVHGVGRLASTCGRRAPAAPRGVSRSVFDDAARKAGAGRDVRARHRDRGVARRISPGNAWGLTGGTLHHPMGIVAASSYDEWHKGNSLRTIRTGTRI